MHVTSCTWKSLCVYAPHRVHNLSSPGFLKYWVRWTGFFVILEHFLPICPLKPWKIKILEKWKKTTGDVIILHNFTKNQDHMLYCSWDMASDGCNCYFSFWTIFCPFTSFPLTPLTGQKMKLSKKIKKITHIWRRWGIPQNFLLAFIDEFEKQIISKKTVEGDQ